MDYVTFLVDCNKNKNELELAEFYNFAEKLKKEEQGSFILGETMQTAILWILKIKPKNFVRKYNKLRRTIADE